MKTWKLKRNCLSVILAVCVLCTELMPLSVRADGLTVDTELTGELVEDGELSEGAVKSGNEAVMSEAALQPAGQEAVDPETAAQAVPVPEADKKEAAVQTGMEPETAGQSQTDMDQGAAGQSQTDMDQGAAGQSQTDMDQGATGQSQTGMDQGAAGQSQTGMEQEAADQTDTEQEPDGQGTGAQGSVGQAGVEPEADSQGTGAQGAAGQAGMEQEPDGQGTGEQGTAGQAGMESENDSQEAVGQENNGEPESIETEEEAALSLASGGGTFTLNVNESKTLYLDVASDEGLISALWNCNSSDFSINASGSTCRVTALRYSSIPAIVDCTYYCTKSYFIAGRRQIVTIPHYVSYTFYANGSSNGTTGTCNIANWPSSVNVAFPGSSTFTITAGTNLSDKVYLKENSSSGNCVSVFLLRTEGNKAYYRVDANAPGTQTVTFQLIYQESSTKMTIKDKVSIKFTVTCAHIYDQGTVTKPPTASATGIRTYTCLNCGYKKTETIPVIANTMAECEITLSDSSYVYHGAECRPTVCVKHFDTYLKQGTDFQVTYKNNVNAGKGEAIITGTGAYSGTVSKTFTINKADQTVTVSVPVNSVEVNGTLQITAKGAGTITYTSGNTEVAEIDTEGMITGKGEGTAEITVTASGDSNYKSASKTIEITVTGEQPASISFSSDTVRLGVNDSKVITVSASGNLPSRYVFGYKKNIDTCFSASWTGDWVGDSHDITITGKRGGTDFLTIYLKDSGTGIQLAEGIISITVEPETVSISDCTVTLSASSFRYDGTAKKPSVTVKYGTSVLVKEKDYSLTYCNNINAGQASVKITGKGDYSGTVSKTFTIQKADQTLSVSMAANTVKVKGTMQIKASGIGRITYSSKSPGIAAVNSSGLITGKAKGKAVIIVTAAGSSNYNSISKTVEITVTEGSSANSTVSVSYCTVLLSSSSYTYNGRAKTPSVSVRYKGRTLVKNRDYTVAYRNNVNAGTATVTITGKGSFTGSVKKTFRIRKAYQSFRVLNTSYYFSKTGLRRSAQSFTIRTAQGKGALSYKSNTKYITVSKGKATVKKGTPAGIYRITVTAAGNSNYYSSSKTIRVVVW